MTTQKFWEVETAAQFTSIISAQFTHKQSALKHVRYVLEVSPGAEYRLWHWQKQAGSRYVMVWKLVETNGQTKFPVKYALI